MIGVLEGPLSGVCLGCRHDKAYARAFFSFGKKAFQIKIFMLCQLGISIFMLSSSDWLPLRIRRQALQINSGRRSCVTSCLSATTITWSTSTSSATWVSKPFTCFHKMPVYKTKFSSFWKWDIWQQIMLGPKFHFILKSVSKICWFNLAYSTRLIWSSFRYEQYSQWHFVNENDLIWWDQTATILILYI